MKRLSKSLLFCMLAGVLVAPAHADPLVIQEQGSFAAGGAVVTAPGTFDLAMHSWDDPLEQIVRLAAEQQIPLITPVMGEPLNVLTPHEGSAWWRD